jgi:hypothetical protein
VQREYSTIGQDICIALTMIGDALMNIQLKYLQQHFGPVYDALKLHSLRARIGSASPGHVDPPQ